MLYQHTERPFRQRHPWVTCAAVLVAGLLLINGWYLSVLVASVIMLAIAVRRRNRAEARRRSGLLARADFENRLTLAGDPRGMYGRYPPVQWGYPWR